MKNEYVVAFVFDRAGGVWLIEKNHPEWQKGSMNGIGGKIKEGETPEEAIHREMSEEAGAENLTLVRAGKMEGINNDGAPFEVVVFTGYNDQILKTNEEEKVMLMPLEQVKTFKHIQNVPALIELCIYKLNAKSHFKEFCLWY